MSDEVVDSDERIYASILRENQTWADRCADLAAENFALRSALLDVQSAIRDALDVPMLSSGSER